MANEIEIKSDEFDKAVSVLKLIGINLVGINKNLVKSGNAIECTWEGKSGEGFSRKNKKLCENIKALGESITTLAEQLKNINEAFEELDNSIVSKLRR